MTNDASENLTPRAIEALNHMMRFGVIDNVYLKVMPFDEFAAIQVMLGKHVHNPYRSFDGRPASGNVLPSGMATLRIWDALEIKPAYAYFRTNYCYGNPFRIFMAEFVGPDGYNWYYRSGTAKRRRRQPSGVTNRLERA
jgi:hypothetical protein